MDLQQFYRTDLVVEDEEMVRHQTEKEKKILDETSGVEIEEKREGQIIITDITIDEEAEQRIGKKAGHYITLSAPTLAPYEEELFANLIQQCMQQVQKLAEEHVSLKDSKIVLIGLGNREVTPDAVGPLLMDELKKEIPTYYSEEQSELIVYAPGVTIQTGLETAEFVEAIVRKAKADLLIVVDALAARDANRLCRTIQLTDTGIHPGSGVGNHRKELSTETLGIPVLALGIPTVVDGPVFVADAIDTMFQYLASKISETNNPSSLLSVTPWLRNEHKEVDLSVLKPIFGDWSTWPHDERIQLFEEALQHHNLKTFISPKEIDAWVMLYSQFLADGFNTLLSKVKNK